MKQKTIFDELYDNYKITKPIRLIEFFAGIGSQAKALERLGANFTHYKMCEWAIPSILAYQEIHQEYLEGYGINHSKEITKEQLIDYLYDKGISNNYNEPMKREQIKRLGEQKLRDIYNAIITEHNLVNIMTTRAIDLEMNDRNYEYIWTYSFPCQDLSLAGKMGGMDKNSGTRSGLLWEIERLLDELGKGQLPQMLLMENVPEVVGTNNIENFQNWELKLESLGYSNYIQLLNSKDYNVPQNRKRCFMVSVLGEYNYSFPHKIKREKRLVDLLEEKVDKKYYLSKKMLNCFLKEDTKSYNRKGIFLNSLTVKDKGIAQTITTRAGSRPTDKFIVEVFDFRYDEGVRERVDNDLCPTLTTKVGSKSLSGQPFLKIAQATKQGYAMAKIGDGIYTNRTKQKRGVVQKESVPTIKTSPNDIGFVVEGFDTPIWVRRLTPKECFRIMNFDDTDFIRASKVLSDNMLYHVAGDSIVVGVLEHIFKKIL